MPAIKRNFSQLTISVPHSATRTFQALSVGHSVWVRTIQRVKCAWIYNCNAQCLYNTYYDGESNKTGVAHSNANGLNRSTTWQAVTCHDKDEGRNGKRMRNREKHQTNRAPIKISHKILKEIQTADHTERYRYARVDWHTHAPKRCVRSLCANRHKRSPECCSRYK